LLIGKDVEYNLQQFHLQIAQKEITIANLQHELRIISEEKTKNDANMAIIRNMLNITRADRERLQQQIQTINNMSSNGKTNNSDFNETITASTTTTSSTVATTVQQPLSSSLSFSFSSSIVCGDPLMIFQQASTETKTPTISTTFTSMTTTQTPTTTPPVQSTDIPEVMTTSSNVIPTTTMNVDKQQQQQQNPQKPQQSLEQQKNVVRETDTNHISFDDNVEFKDNVLCTSENFTPIIGK
jgi:hypothetical protein